METKEHCLVGLSERYPQLRLPIREGERLTEEYRDAVLCGEGSTRPLLFSMSPEDTLTTETTPAGTVEVLYLKERADFVHAIRAVAERCEPAEVPDSMGAGFVSGLIDWGKIHRHLREYEADGGEDPDGEFERFTAIKENFKSELVLLSAGAYSAVQAEELSLEPEDWLRKSVIIRKFHELTHFTSRRLFLQNKEAIRDEVLADCIGLLAAFGHYDPETALRLFGIDGEECCIGGRLRNYTEPEKLPEAIQRVRHIVSALPAALAGCPDEATPFECLVELEKTGFCLIE